MDIRNIQSILPTADADFLSHVLDLFQRSESVIELNGSILDKAALIPQVKSKLYKKGIAYKGADIIVLDAALSFYLRYFADNEGKRDIAERLQASTKAAFEQITKKLK